MKPSPGDITWTMTVNARSGLKEAIESLEFMFTEHGYLDIEIQAGRKNSGSQPMLNTWMMWMEETARWMSWNGAKMPLVVKEGIPWGERKFEQRDAHELFTRQYLGTDENGRRKTWKRCSPDSGEVKASTGDRLHAMDCHLAWASERGLSLTIPRGCEYQNLKDEANA